MKDKICALIRQTWYETAKKNLQPAERLRFYEICLEYEFYNQAPDDDAPFSARLLFDMVKNDIDEDKAKTIARAERARINGRGGGRPKATQENTSDKNPVGFLGTDEKLYTNTNTHTSTLHNTESVSENEDTHTFFSVCLLFFEKGCSDPCGEGEKFWNYYESLGWKTKSGGEIVDRLALARAWRLSDCSKLAMRNRAPYADLMHKADPVEISLLRDFVEMTRDAATEKVIITLQERASCIILDQKYMPALRQWIPKRSDGSPFNLEYRALNTHLD